MEIDAKNLTEVISESPDLVLRENSLEQFIESVWTLINEQADQIGDYESGDLVPVATFSRNTIVKDLEGNYYNLSIERENYRATGINEVEELNIDQYNAEEVDLEDLRKKELETYVESFLEEGQEAVKTEQAFNRLMNLAVVSDEKPEDRRLSSKLKRTLEKPSKWQRYVEDKRNEVRKLLRGEIGQIQDTCPEQRFERLYKTNSDEAFENQNNNLDNAIEALKDRFEGFYENVESALGRIGEDQNWLEEIEGDIIELKFQEVLESLKSDIEFILNIINEAQFEGSREKGRIHDELAGVYEDFAIASKFSNKLVNSILTFD